MPLDLEAELMPALATCERLLNDRFFFLEHEFFPQPNSLKRPDCGVSAAVFPLRCSRMPLDLEAEMMLSPRISKHSIIRFEIEAPPLYFRWESTIKCALCRTGLQPVRHCVYWCVRCLLVLRELTEDEQRRLLETSSLLMT